MSSRVAAPTTVVPSSGGAIDPRLVLGWLTARSIARNLPPPVPDRGGFRVDTGSATEAVRWVFPHVTEGLLTLADELHEPRRFIKLCADDASLRRCLPERWQVQPSAFVMTTNGEAGAPELAAPYRLHRERIGCTTHVRVCTVDGELAASGFAAEAGGFFVYDRIVTEPMHRRRGLGRAVMRALGGERSSAAVPQVLVATDEGRALYRTLGWTVVSAYASAVIPAR